MQSSHNIIRSKQSVNVVKLRSLPPPSLACFINSRDNPFQFPSRTLQTKCVSCSFVTIFRHCSRACNHAQSSRAREPSIQLAPKQHDHAEQIRNPRLWATGFIKIVWLAGKRSHTRPTTLVHCLFALAQFSRAQHVPVIKLQ